MARHLPPVPPAARRPRGYLHTQLQNDNIQLLLDPPTRDPETLAERRGRNLEIAAVPAETPAADQQQLQLRSLPVAQVTRGAQLRPAQPDPLLRPGETAQPAGLRADTPVPEPGLREPASSPRHAAPRAGQRLHGHVRRGARASAVARARRVRAEEHHDEDIRGRDAALSGAAQGRRSVGHQARRRAQRGVSSECLVNW